MGKTEGVKIAQAVLSLRSGEASNHCGYRDSRGKIRTELPANLFRNNRWSYAWSADRNVVSVPVLSVTR